MGVRDALAAQATRITRRGPTKLAKKTNSTTDNGDAITWLTAQASPANLACMLPGHRAIDDRPHPDRDMIYDEDRSPIRTANGPASWQPLRNLTMSILRLAGHTSVAAALRYHARRLTRPPHEPSWSPN